jgi:hypothetical protein
MNSSVVQEVLEINNECVKQLHDENLLQGVQNLRRAIKKVESAASLTPTLNRKSSDPPKIRMEPSRKWSPSPSQQWEQQRETSGGFVYDRPFLLYCSTNSDHDEEDSYNCIVVIATITLNIAIIYHRYGMNHGYDAYLIQASKLYMVTIELVNHLVVPSDNYNQNHFFLLMLALNNFAQVHYELSSYLAYDQTMSTLRHLFARYSYQIDLLGRNDDDETTIPQIDGLRANIMIWQLLPTFAARAA